MLVYIAKSNQVDTNKEFVSPFPDTRKQQSTKKMRPPRAVRVVPPQAWQGAQGAEENLQIIELNHHTWVNQGSRLILGFSLIHQVYISYRSLSASSNQVVRVGAGERKGR